MSKMSTTLMFILTRVLPVLGVTAGVAMVGALRFLRFMYHSVKPLPPTKKQMEEEDMDKNLLFKYVPALKGKVAWRQIGDYPTPIHKLEIGKEMSFWVKREDLSNGSYGGNKVRTLQHLLGSAEAFAAKNPTAKFIVTGSSGSNQCVAATVHGLKTCDLSVEAFWAMPDEPEMDNTLNMLSVLSFPIKWTTPADGYKKLKNVFRLLTSDDTKVFNLGGNNIAGVFGQIGALLELAEQIQKGDVPDPEGLVVTCGSFCTFTGLLMGIVIARRTPALNKAFRHPNFKLYGVAIHHQMALGIRAFDMMRIDLARLVPLSPVYGIEQVSDFIVKCGGEDYKADCLSFLRSSSVEFIADAEMVEIYGTHSKMSSAAAKLYEEKGAVFDENGKKATDLWLCGHFASKSFAAIVRKIRQEKAAAGIPETENVHRNIIFWQTKSVVQPRGSENEFKKLQTIAHDSKAMREWVQNGKAYSTKLRPGEVDLTKTSETYRHLMTHVEL